MKKSPVLVCAALFSLVLLAGCAGGQSASSATSSSASSATATSGTANEVGLVVDTQAKTVTFPATSTGHDGESSIHFLVSESGSNAGVAHFTTPVTSRELYDALEQIGGTHGDNIALEDTGGTIEGSDLKMTIAFDGKEFDPGELVAAADNRPCQVRFGGNIEPNEEVGTGCLFCMESCSLGITSNAAYEYTEPAEFAPTSNMPAAKTDVTITYALQ